MPDPVPVLKRAFHRRLVPYFSFPIAIGFLLLFKIVSSSIDNLPEPDIWWHLRNAEFITRTHTFLRADPYSFTVPGAPWMDHEWLSEIVYYGAYRCFGLRGILGLCILLVAAIFAALYYLSCRNGANPKAAAMVALLGVLLASVSFGPRMLLFGWLMMVVLLITLQRYAATRSGPLWLLPLLFALWINLHGSWVFGIVTLCLFVASGLIEGEWGSVIAVRFTPPELRRLLIVAAASFAALLLNPYGYRLPTYPFDLMFRQRNAVAVVSEWLSVDFHTVLGKVVIILLLSIFSCTLVSRRRWTLFEVLLSAFALYASLTYVRMQFFAALVFVPLLALRLPFIPPYEESKDKPLLNAAIMIAVVALVLHGFPDESNLLGAIRAEYPADAVNFLRDRKLNGRLFNSYNWGGYVIWHLPETKIFIDGRADVYAHGTAFDDYVSAVHIQDTFAVLDRYRIDYTLMESNSAMVYLLRHSPCWREIYRDKVAVIDQRTTAEGSCAPSPPASAESR